MNMSDSYRSAEAGPFLHWPIKKIPPWSARWIAPPGCRDEPNVYFRVRRSWVLSDCPASSILHIAAESNYHVYVNGLRVGLGPARGTKTRNYFDSYEIASLLQAGINWIAIAGHTPNVPTFQAAPAQPGVWAQLDDGEFLVTDDSWETQLAAEWRRDVRSFTFQIGFFEWQNLGQIPLDWTTGRDGGVGWSPAEVISANEVLADKVLVPRDIPALREEAFSCATGTVLGTVPRLEDRLDPLIAQRMDEELHQPLTHVPDLTVLAAKNGGPVVIEPLAQGEGIALLFDFGREINGAFEFDMEAAPGTIVDIAYDEDRGGRLPVLLNAYAFADRYITKAGRQTVGNVFTARGFRCVQVVIREFMEPLRIHAVRGVDRLYPYAETSRFVSSDPLLNDVWTACVQTMKACSTDTFVDCPWRENAFYINDLVVENVTGLQLFGDARLSARCLRLMASQAREDGLIPGSVPCGILPGMTLEASEDFLILLGGNLFLPLVLEEYLVYTGDETVVRDLALTVDRLLSAFARWEDAEGLVLPPARHWNFIDWSFEMTDPEGRRSLSGRNTAVLNWFYVLALDGAARLAAGQGDSVQADRWRDKAAAVSRAIDARFWSEEKRCYVEWREDGEDSPLATQISQALALLSGRVPAGRREDLAAALTRSDLLAPELYLHHFILRALVVTGQEAAALSLIHRYWGPVIQAGSPTIWECGVHEQGKAAFGGNASACHGFATTPVDFFQCVILGVRPTEPGFALCRISPRTLGLARASGTVLTPHGPISVDWRREDGELLLEITLPVGVTAELPDGTMLPAGSFRARLQENSVFC